MEDNIKKASTTNINFINKDKVSVRGNLYCGQNVKIDINTIFEGENRLGDNVEIHPNSIIRNCTIGNNSIIKPYSLLEHSVIGDSCSIGPYSNIRSDCLIDNLVNIGNFVEIKNSKIKSNTKINHMSFIGDANIGENVIIGAGTITCNHDGKKHNSTTIKKNAYIGSGTKLIAPIVIGENSIIGAGSVITKNVPDNELVVVRSKQKSTIK
tara:strand:+ start:4618 stop:5247 length:630 start_codon:yes stop_codon:yes gene_type:complete